MDEEILMQRLKSLPMEEASGDLASRIIARAAMRPQRMRPFSLFTYLSEAFAECLLPRPAFALFGVLLAGLMFGFTVPPASPQPQVQVHYVQDILGNKGWAK